MLQTSIDFFLSAFRWPGLAWAMILLSILLGVGFGILWLAGYRPALRKHPGFLGILTVSAFLTWAAIAFVQVPLQNWTGQALVHLWSQRTLTRWLYLAAVPQILLSGVVQEASKLATIIGYWRIGRVHLEPREGLLAGAVAGAGFGVFEAVWVFNTLFFSGWRWANVNSGGLSALWPFWERFFTVGFHIALSGLAGWGLAKKLGWQFYVIAAVLHGAANYSVVLLQKRLLTAAQTEYYIAAFAIALTAVVLWLRWKEPKESGR